MSYVKIQRLGSTGYKGFIMTSDVFIRDGKLIGYNPFGEFVIYQSDNKELLDFLKTMIEFEKNSNIKLRKNETIVSQEDLKIYVDSFFRKDE